MLRPCASAFFNQMKAFLVSRSSVLNITRSMSRKVPGKCGSTRDIFKSIGTAKEAQFFNKKEKELLQNLRDEMKEQISFHEEQIAKHKAVIKKLKSKQKDL